MYRRIVILIVSIIVIIGLSTSIKYEDIKESKTIKVEVKGEVKDDLITLPLGSTIDDLLKVIELTSDSDISMFSRNTTLYNNQIIVIPKLKEYELISINSATIEQLCTLPGIGEATALKIIDYRNTYGCFNDLQELKNVKGIGDKKYEKLKDYITL